VPAAAVQHSVDGQVAGGLVWSLGLPLAGYELGSHIHSNDHYLLPIIAVIVVSLIPVGRELLRSGRDWKAAQ
jgi:membrane-associated protein